MKRPVTAFVLALTSVIVAPILLMVELAALLFAAMVTYEPANSLLVKALSVAIVVAVGLLALSLPVLSLLSGIRARSAATTLPTGASLAIAAVVIAGLVTVGVFAFQVYVILLATGVSSL